MKFEIGDTVRGEYQIENSTHPILYGFIYNVDKPISKPMFNEDEEFFYHAVNQKGEEFVNFFERELKRIKIVLIEKC
jgi:hypothetical protein